MIDEFLAPIVRSLVGDAPVDGWVLRDSLVESGRDLVFAKGGRTLEVWVAPDSVDTAFAFRTRRFKIGYRGALGEDGGRMLRELAERIRSGEEGLAADALDAWQLPGSGTAPDGMPGDPRPAPEPEPGPPELPEDTALFPGNQRSAFDPGRWRRFVSRMDVERDVLSDLRYVGPHSFVIHGEYECVRVRPRGPGRTRRVGSVIAHDFGPPQRRTFSTHVQDLDLINGTNPALEKTLEVVRRDPTDEVVVLYASCPVRLLAEDMSVPFADHHRAGGAPIVEFLTGGRYYHESLAVVLRRLCELAPSERSPGPRTEPTVSLVGYPSGPGVEELTVLLRSAGVRVAATLIPDVGLGLVRAVRESDVIVANPFGPWKDIVDNEIALPGQGVVAPDLPYGAARTRSWLETVARAAGGEEAVSHLYRVLPAQAAVPHPRSGVGLVGSPPEVRSMCDAGRFFGVALAPVLLDLGFDVSVFVYQDAAWPDLPDGTLAGLMDLPVGVGMTRFTTPQQLETLLRGREDVGAVFDQYEFDDRLYRAGKASFGLRDLEMGFEGAERTAARIAERCAWRGPAVFGRGT